MSGYPNTLKYYMWGFQAIYRINCETHAEELFNRLDRGLQPKVSLIGFLKRDSPEKHPICVDPESLESLIDKIQNVDEKASELLIPKDGRRIFYTGEGVQEKMDKQKIWESKRIALKQTVEELPEYGDSAIFVSKRLETNDYNFYVILELNKFVYNSHFHLKKSDTQERIRLRLSLLQCAVETYLDEVTRAFNETKEDEFFEFECRNTEEILKIAANNFISTIAYAGRDFKGIHGLIETCNKISQSRYEGEELKGSMLVAKKDHPDIEMAVELIEPFSIRDYRKTRKLLQQSDTGNSVVTNSSVVLGLGKIKDSYSPTDESIFTINFESLHKWEVEHNQKVLMQMNFGLPQFSEEIINKDFFQSNAQRIFEDISETDIVFIYLLSVYLTQMKKGAMLIISDQAEQEAIRLAKQCLAIKPKKLTLEILRNMSKIDGGVLIDRHGICYANGVLLDGVVGRRGDAARGSRYNSALTYHENNELSNSTMIVVVSEDGMVDIIPSLRPKIRHSNVTAVIEILREIEKEKVTEKGTFNEVMQWLKDKSFYLTKDECHEVNALNDIISERDKGASMRILHEKLEPDPEMNDTYYDRESKDE